MGKFTSGCLSGCVLLLVFYLPATFPWPWNALAYLVDIAVLAAGAYVQTHKRKEEA